MDSTRGGTAVSAQIAQMGIISDLNTGNFKKDDTPWNLKNDGDTAVILEVNLWDMIPGEFIATRFDVGWNPEIIREIKQTSLSNLNLRWGF